jgi:ubiquinone/menaquinone biosynthesis C-methylase UbiE
MDRSADGIRPGAFDEAQAQTYATAMDIESEFPHDRMFLDLLRHHAHDRALDLGGGSGRYAAWLLHTALATSAHLIDQSPTMIDACMRRGIPGLSTQVADIETVDLECETYDLALARFILMHIRELERTLNHIAMSLKARGTLVVVTNVIEGNPAALATCFEETPRIVQLILQTHRKPMLVSNYARTQDEYIAAMQQAGLRIEFSEGYAPKIVRFAKAYPGIRLSHVVLMAKK